MAAAKENFKKVIIDEKYAIKQYCNNQGANCYIILVTVIVVTFFYN